MRKSRGENHTERMMRRETDTKRNIQKERAKEPEREGETETQTH